ncbi:hypothetical protein F5X97DRAFT_311897 [Nemania serpens]|nr:hypothetical protein F5X97DRAFT_311897 [Nemania serpens]
MPDVEPFFGTHALIKYFPLQRSTILARRLLNTLVVCCRDNFLLDGSARNMSIAALTATIPGQHFYYDWRGPVVAYSRLGEDLDPPCCRDTDMVNFRHVADYLTSYGSDLPTPEKQPGDIKIKGVRINCLGDQKICKRPHFEAVDVSSSDSMICDVDISDIATRIGLPILSRRCPPDPSWASQRGSPIPKSILKGESPYNNQDATLLHLCCDPKADGSLAQGAPSWGWPLGQWQRAAGSVIIVREDKKPLSPLHVEALCKYCRCGVLPLFCHSRGEYAPDEPLKRELVLEMICRPLFSICWYKLLEEKWANKEYPDDPFPYDV